MLPGQCKAARAALGLGVRELAAKAGVSPDTVVRLEKGEALHQRTGIAIREALLPALSSRLMAAYGSRRGRAARTGRILQRRAILFPRVKDPSDRFVESAERVGLEPVGQHFHQ
jgi:transcriptional regulator with XRE-family HTH domain